MELLDAGRKEVSWKSCIPQNLILRSCPKSKSDGLKSLQLKSKKKGTEKLLGEGGQLEASTRMKNRLHPTSVVSTWDPPPQLHHPSLHCPSLVHKTQSLHSHPAMAQEVESRRKATHRRHRLLVKHSKTRPSSTSLFRTDNKKGKQTREQIPPAPFDKTKTMSPSKFPLVLCKIPTRTPASHLWFKESQEQSRVCIPWTEIPGTCQEISIRWDRTLRCTQSQLRQRSS
mmetsp:Transcript_14437/g.49309  ORF Transcript_14437/g.49309 Transcript_14437/m.49309 type:complete len:228 (-) Transcript_14437:2206-2889(-)